MGGSSSPQPRARSTSPLRPIKNVPQAAMYDYLYGWEEYLRRSKEREFSVIYKKAPPGEMPFRAGRSRQRPHRFLKPNTSPEEMGWRQLLGCSEDTDRERTAADGRARDRPTPEATRARLHRCFHREGDAQRS